MTVADAQARRRRPSVLIRVSVAIAAVVLAIASAELVLRFVPVLPTYRMYGFEVRLDPDLLFRLVPRSSADINAWGYRDRDFTGLGNPHRIVVLGDSFVMGYNVDSGRTFPKQLERDLVDTDVLNLGVYGYGPDQSLRQLVTDGVSLSPEIVLLALFPANDFNDIAKNQMLDFPEGGGIVFSERNPVRRALGRFVLPRLVRRVVTGRWLPRDRERELFVRLFFDSFDLLDDSRDPRTRAKLDAMSRVLREFRDWCAGAGIRFGVIILPSFEDVQDRSRLPLGRDGAPHPFANERLARGLCRSLDIATLDLSEGFRSRADEGLYDPEDHHLSEAGNDFVAAEVAAFLRGPIFDVDRGAR